MSFSRKLERQYNNSDNENLSSDEEEPETENGLVEEEGDEAIYIDELYCVACNKSFKNHSSISNHQASKKHLENIERLKLEMLEEEGNFENSLSEEELEDEEEEAVVKISKKKKKMKNKKALLVVNSDDEEEEEAEVENIVVEAEKTVENGVKEDESLEEKFEEVKVEERVIISKKKNKKNKKVVQKQKSDDEDEEEEIGKISEDDDEDWDNSRKGKKSKSKSKSKKKQTNNDSSDPEIDVDVDHVCVTCKQQFESKNKLFQHLKKTKHGVYIPKITDQEVIDKKSKKKR